jgi:hypothetical protein
MKRLEEEVARLRNQYHIELNEEFFAGKIDNAAAIQAELENKQQQKSVKVTQNEPSAKAKSPTALV